MAKWRTHLLVSVRRLLSCQSTLLRAVEEFQQQNTAKAHKTNACSFCSVTKRTASKYRKHRHVQMSEQASWLRRWHFQRQRRLRVPSPYRCRDQTAALRFRCRLRCLLFRTVQNSVHIILVCKHWLIHKLIVSSFTKVKDLCKVEETQTGVELVWTTYKCTPLQKRRPHSFLFLGKKSCPQV